MKNYNVTSIPSIFAGLSKKRTMSYYATEFGVPNPKLGVDYYGNFGSRYNVFRVDAVGLVDCGCNMQSVMLVHTPDGKQHLLYNNSSSAKNHLNYFEKKEDFMNYVLNGDNENRMPYITLKAFLKESFETYTFNYGGYEGNTFDILGYRWDGGKVEVEPTFFEIAWRDNKGLHVIFDNNLYTTKEECFKDNFQLNTGVFPEDKPKSKSYVISVTLQITAETLEEAQKVAEQKVAYLEE